MTSQSVSALNPQEIIEISIREAEESGLWTAVRNLSNTLAKQYHSGVVGYGQAEVTMQTFVRRVGNGVVSEQEAVSTLKKYCQIPEEVETFPSAISWPVMDECAFHGLAGDIVRAIEPHTEADPTAILLQSLVAFGSVAGRSAHYLVEADKHYTNSYVALVGSSAKGRKGTSWGHVARIFEQVDPEYMSSRVVHGLSSGEGLKWVRDPVEHSGKSKRADEGVHDKRLLVYEAEFASVLKVLRREGNTLSAILRCAWDSGNLRSLTKNDPVVATDAHISLIVHITKQELVKNLTDTECGNGFANRFLWICVRRSKVLPHGGQIQKVDLRPYVNRLNEAIEFSRTLDAPIEFERQAACAWESVYPALSAEKPGIFGAVVARGEAQVIRLASLYALLDLSTQIGEKHLRAALAVWQYAEDSCRYIFGDSTGDEVADRIIQVLRQNSDGLTRTQIYTDVFHRNRNSSEIASALQLLESVGYVGKVRITTSGRPMERWRLTPQYREAKNGQKET